jgi:Family of unknown function (DUF5362)
METSNDLLQNDLVIDAVSAGNVKESAMWAKFLGIVGFIYSGIISVLAVFMGWFFERAMPRQIIATKEAAIGGVVFFFLSLYLFKFGSKAQAAFKGSDQESLAESLKNLKYYFRFIGVVTLISLVLTVLGVVGILMTAAFGA